MEPSPLPSPPLAPSDVTIIVPVGGAAPSWSRSAASLARLDPPPGEIIAVIDGANEALARQAAEIGARVILLEKRSGPAKARNRGVEVADGEILFFLDSDIEVPPRLVAQIVALFNADPRMAAVIGSYDDAPGDPAFLSQYRNLLHHYVHQTGREEASTFWSGCGAIRRQAFDDVSGFDENYPVPSIEDIELGARLRRAGHTLRLAKNLQVKHLKRWRLLDMLRTDLLRRAVPWTELMLREGEIVNDLNVKTRDRLSVALAFFAPMAILAGGIWWPALGLGAAAAVGVVGLNAKFFRFLGKKRGRLFALRAVPFYWAYLVTCGLGFALGAGSWVARRKR